MEEKADIYIKGVLKSRLILFDETAKKNGKSRSEYLRYLIENIATLPIVLDSEMRFEYLCETILKQLEMNTNALIGAIENGIVPPFNEGEKSE